MSMYDALVSNGLNSIFLAWCCTFTTPLRGTASYRRTCSKIQPDSLAENYGKSTTKKHQAVVTCATKDTTVPTQLADSEDCCAFLIYHGVKLLNVTWHICLILICPVILIFTCYVQVLIVFYPFYDNGGCRTLSKCWNKKVASTSTTAPWRGTCFNWFYVSCVVGYKSYESTPNRRNVDLCYSFLACVYFFSLIFDFLNCFSCSFAV
jgi:hypothetical protein